MAHLGTLRDFRFENSADDIRGAVVYGRDDEKLGEIKDVIFDHSTAQLKYLVVDTGGWLHSRQFLVPADRVRPHDNKDDEFFIDLSKKQIENFPRYDESCMNDEKRWKEYECEYRGTAKFEQTGGILHQAGTTNILVPEGLPAEGPAPVLRRITPSGYRSPIRHHEVGLMDTSPIGNKPDDERLTFFPDAIGVDRGDVENKELEPDFPLNIAETKASCAKPSSSGNTGVGSVDPPVQAAPSPHPHEVVHRGDDSFPHPDPSAPVEETIDGDALFNSEDLAGRKHEGGNVHDADEPNYSRIGGTETETSPGRLPNHPDASQGQRWARFEEDLRRERPKIVARCSICEEFQNRHREDAA